jgi:hypothetical protein
VPLLQTKPPLQVPPEQQFAPAVLHVVVDWHLFATQARPLLQVGGLPGLHGWFSPPVVMPVDDWLQVSEVLLHAIAPLQQGWPLSPQGAPQTLFVQLRPLAQLFPVQQAAPLVPQALHMPVTQTFPEVQVSPGSQQGLPTSPHEPPGLSHTPPVQARPAQQSLDD